jgi:hypothetical protein
MVRLANSHRDKHADRDNWLIEPDLPENVGLAVEWLKTKAKIAVEGQGGDNMAYATAAHMKSFGLSPEMAFDLMWEHWNPRCVPPWDAGEADHLLQKITNGYSYNTSPPGNITPAYHVAKSAAIFKPTIEDKGEGFEWTGGRFRVVDRLGGDSIKPPEWLIHDFIPEGGYVILFGAPGTFKTFVALDVALSVVTGLSAAPDRMWGDVVEPGNVLFSLGEGRPQIMNRIRAWEALHNKGKNANGIFIMDPVPMVTEAVQPFLEVAKAASPAGYKLVVLDTIGRSMQGVNENAQEHASKFTHLVETIQKELGAAVLALHHSGHGNTERGKGSMEFIGAPDTIVGLDRPGKEYLVSLSMPKQKDSPEWTKAKHLKLTEVRLTPKHTSLAVIKPSPDELPISRDTIEEQDKVELFDAIEKAAIAVLKRVPGHKFNNGALIEACAAEPGVTVGSSQIGQKYWKAIREDKQRQLGKFYDAIKREFVCRPGL